MLGNQLDRGAVADRVGLGQILHRFDQSALTIHVPGIRGSFSAFAAYAGDNWNGKDFGHEKFTHRWWKPVYLPIREFPPLIFLV
jgi:hypothetical protein